MNHKIFIFQPNQQSHKLPIFNWHHTGSLAESRDHQRDIVGGP